MGLLLSILVSCVGVVELIAFYSHLRRCLGVANPEDSGLETVTRNYKKMLTKKYRQIFAEINGKEVHKEVTTNFSLSTSPKAIFHSEENHKELALNAKSSENHVSDKNHIFKLQTSHFSSVPTEVEMSHVNHSSYFPNEATNSAKSMPVQINASQSDHQINYLPTQGHRNLETLPMEINTPNFPHETNFMITETVFNGPQTTINIISETEFDVPTLGVERIYLLEEFIEDPIYGGRCPSPFPTYETMAPRNSMCSDLLEDPIVSLIEVEEDAEMEFDIYPPYRDIKSNRVSFCPVDQYDVQVLDLRRNRSVSPIKSTVEDDTMSHLKKRRRSKSSSDLYDYNPALDYQLVVEDYWRRSPSPFEQLLTDNFERMNQQYVLVEEIFSDDFKNSLDGVKIKSPNEERKREFKKKRNNRNRLSQSSLDDYVSSDSKENLQVALQYEENVFERLKSAFRKEEIMLDINTEILPATTASNSSPSRECVILKDTNSVEVKATQITSVSNGTQNIEHNSETSESNINYDNTINTNSDLVECLNLEAENNVKDQSTTIISSIPSDTLSNKETALKNVESDSDKEHERHDGREEIPTPSENNINYDNTINTNSALVECLNLEAENNVKDQSTTIISSIPSDTLSNKETALKNVESDSNKEHERHDGREEIPTSESSSNSSSNNTVVLREPPTQEISTITEEHTTTEPSTSSNTALQNKDEGIPIAGSSKNQKKPEAFWVK